MNISITTTAKTVNLTQPPDLAVTQVTPPANAQAGHSLTVSYHVNNLGAGPTHPRNGFHQTFVLRSRQASRAAPGEIP